MNNFVFLLIILVLAVGIPIILNIRNPMQMLEGYSNYNLAGAMGKYPKAQTSVLVQDTYPAIGKNELSNATSADIWNEYPVYEMGSYEQKTNNIRYPYTPDEGTCMPATMCNALYKKKVIGKNYVLPLPPVNIVTCGRRINYYNTDINLLPYRTNLANILY